MHQIFCPTTDPLPALQPSEIYKSVDNHMGSIGVFKLGMGAWIPPLRVRTALWRAREQIAAGRLTQSNWAHNHSCNSVWWHVQGWADTSGVKIRCL